ncbi:MAG: prepilin-type N-terminal cleavage/methylation domain-containing protein [Planctomycetota bacterium]|jgi:prepilin-type N-terminal cleavage/methylation domain-containing protein
MRSVRGQSGMSLMEVLAALAIILILIGSLIGVGSFVKTRAQLDLTKGLLETLCTALGQYYSDQTPNAFPFDTPDTGGDGILGNDYLVNPDLMNDLQGTVNGGLLDEDASSAALFYFLDQYPSSRAVVEDLANTLVTNKDDSGMNITFTFTVAVNTIDLPRYVDPWGTSIRYVYLAGTAFPVLTSAGPDKVFDTPDDITSK